MILEVAVIAGLTIGAERAYKAYKRGTLLTDLTNSAAGLKSQVTAVESKLKASVPVVEADVQALVAAAKVIVGKL